MRGSSLHLVVAVYFHIFGVLNVCTFCTSSSRANFSGRKRRTPIIHMSDHNIGSYTRQFHKTKKCYGHVFRFKKEQRDRTRLENIVAKTNVQSETCSTYGVNQQDDNTQTSNQDIRSVSSGRRIQSNSNSYLSHASRIENDEQMMSLLRRETRIRRRYDIIAIIMFIPLRCY